MNILKAARQFLARFYTKENAVNPEDQAPVEETQEAADSPPAEETVEEVPADPPVEPVDVVPAQTIDDLILSGAKNVQMWLTGYRHTKTAEHEAKMALVAARAQAQKLLDDAQLQIEATDGAEDSALDNVNAAIDAQIANLNSLRETLNA